MKSILILAAYDSFLQADERDNLTLGYIAELTKIAKVSIIISESIDEFKKATKHVFENKNVSWYSIASIGNTSSNNLKFIPKKLKKYLRYCFYKKQITGKTDTVFLKYYHLLVMLLKREIFDIIILQNPSSQSAISVIRKFDKNVTIIYDTTTLNANQTALNQQINTVIGTTKEELKSIQANRNKKVNGISIGGIAKRDMKRVISDFIDEQPPNIKKWKMKIHFLTFVSSNFKTTLSRIKTEAENSGFFDTITCLSEFDLPKDYIIEYKITQGTKGFGYWIWKSYVTKQLLSKINFGDILVYADGGCTINVEGRKRFYEYIEMLSHSDFSSLSFQLKFPEKQYTKGDVLKYFDAINDEKIKSTGQLVGGIFLLQKDKKSQNLIHRWFSVCHNYRNLIDDSPSNNPNDSEFVENRHDQSVFSILRKMNGSIILRDETHFLNWDENRHYPIHARRWKA